MSILQEYEQIKEEIGKEKFAVLKKYLDENKELFLSDIYYKEAEYNKFEEYYKKEVKSL